MAKKGRKKNSKKTQNEPEAPPAAPPALATELEISPPAYTPKQGNENPKAIEAQWKTNLESLRVAMEAYGQAGKTADTTAIASTTAGVVTVMRQLEATHPDPDVKKEWGDKAEKFAKAGKKERDIMANDVVKGLVLLLATPFLLAGAAVFAAGAIIYGAGSVVRGLGDLLTFGKLGGAIEESDKADKE